MNSQNKGARIERWFKTILSPYFPDIKRSTFSQSDQGGNDFLNTHPFVFEVKGGKKYKSKMIRDILNQMDKQRLVSHMYSIGLIKPQNEKAYCLVSFDDFLKLLDELAANDII